MTDAAYKAKKWLYSLDDLQKAYERTEQSIELIESRLNNAVSRYEHPDYKTDLIIRQEQRENTLLDYSEKRALFEQQYYNFVFREIVIINVLEQVKNRRAAIVVFYRHICKLSIQDITKRSTLELNKSQLYVLYKQGLEELAQILEAEEPKATVKAIENITEIKRRINSHF